MFFKSKSQEAASATTLEPDAMPVIEISPSLETAIDIADAKLRMKGQIQQAVATAIQDIAAIDADLAAARDRLDTVEAQAAMEGDVDPKTARRNLLSLRDQREFSAAKLTGLRTRERDAAAAVAEAQGIMATEWRTWASQQTDALRERYDRAVEVFLDEVAVVMVGATVLGSSASRLNAIARGLTIPHSTDPWKNCGNSAYLKGREVAGARELAEALRTVAGRVLPLIRDIADAPAVPENSGAA